MAKGKQSKNGKSSTDQQKKKGKGGKNKGDKQQQVAQKVAEPKPVPIHKDPNHVPRHIRKAMAKAEANKATREANAVFAAARAARFKDEQRPLVRKVLEGLPVDKITVGGLIFKSYLRIVLDANKVELKRHMVVESPDGTFIPTDLLLKKEYNPVINKREAVEQIHKVFWAEYPDEITAVASYKNAVKKLPDNPGYKTPVNKKPTILAVEIVKQAHTAFTPEAPEVLIPVRPSKVFRKPAVVELAVPFELRTFLGSEGVFQSGGEDERAYFVAKKEHGVGTIKLIFADEKHPLRQAFENFDNGIGAQLQQLRAEPRTVGDVREKHHAREAIRQYLRNIAIGLGLKLPKPKVIADAVEASLLLQGHPQFRVRSNTQPEMRI